MTVSHTDAMLYIFVDYTDKVLAANATSALASAWQTALGIVVDDFQDNLTATEVT